MPHSPFEPFTLLGTTPKIKRVLGGAVALSPVAPLVAETGNLDDGSSVLRITDYQAGKVVGQTSIFNAISCRTLSFSPDGKRLLALAGGFRNFLQVYSGHHPACCVKASSKQAGADAKAMSVSLQDLTAQERTAGSTGHSDQRACDW